MLCLLRLYLLFGDDDSVLYLDLGEFSTELVPLLPGVLLIEGDSLVREVEELEHSLSDLSTC